MKVFGTFLLLTISVVAYTQVEIPAVYTNINQDEKGMYVDYKGTKLYAKSDKSYLTLSDVLGKITPNEKGLEFDIMNDSFNGTLYYGFIDVKNWKHPLPVYFKYPASIKNGKATIDLSSMKGKYDMVGWEENGKGLIGYRILNQNYGKILYDGKIGFTYSKEKGFEIDETIIEGPFVNNVTDKSAVVSFRTNIECGAGVIVEGRKFSNKSKTNFHEIEIKGLKPNTQYDYKVKYGDNSLTYNFKTAPKPGSKSPFTFSYASDSRNGQGGGERDVHGSNNYIMKRIAAINKLRNVSFMQFSGDLINGYLKNDDQMRLQYANWKRSLEPFWHYQPTYVAMGNHEALMIEFGDESLPDVRISMDKFPFDCSSSEAIFRNEFVNPTNGPESEDGSLLDPNPKNLDFPLYDETVYSYNYDNVAMIVLNSNYLYAPSLSSHSVTQGGLHGYIMDNQMQWMKDEIEKFEKDENIDHVFLSLHTPFFPNGGHLYDDMWYYGKNYHRPVIAGRKAAKGIIERRDELLEILVNQSTKVRGILTGDEHNYAKTKISSEMNMYPDDWKMSKLKLNRTIYQINNGSAGAPYYAQEKTPWSSEVSGFSTQNVIVFFHVEGDKIEMEVVNPDTFEEVDRFFLVE